jgi:hypothetical protein
MTAVLVPQSDELARERVRYLCGRTGQKLPPGLGQMGHTKLASNIERLEKDLRNQLPDPSIAMACHSDLRG